MGHGLPGLQELGSGSWPVIPPATVRKSVTVFTSPFAGKLPTARSPPALVKVRLAVGTADQYANKRFTRATPVALSITIVPLFGCWLRGPPSTPYAIVFVLSHTKHTPHMPFAGPPTASGPPATK